MGARQFKVHAVSFLQACIQSEAESDVLSEHRTCWYYWHWFAAHLWKPSCWRPASACDAAVKHLWCVACPVMAYLCTCHLLRKDESSVQELLIFAKNPLMTGLVAVMLLLGFGLVHIPRTMLREADPASRLHYALYKCDTVSSPCTCPVRMHVSPTFGLRCILPVNQDQDRRWLQGGKGGREA